MKVSFTGAQSTGKTTLLEAIKQNEEFRYKYEFIDEITRRMIKKGLKINEEGGNTTQLLIMNEHIKNTLYTEPEVKRKIESGERELEDFYLDIADNVESKKVNPF